MGEGKVLILQMGGGKVLILHDGFLRGLSIFGRLSFLNGGIAEWGWRFADCDQIQSPGVFL
jgi:hypothetical protein